MAWPRVAIQKCLDPWFCRELSNTGLIKFFGDLDDFVAFPFHYFINYLFRNLRLIASHPSRMKPESDRNSMRKRQFSAKPFTTSHGNVSRRRRTATFSGTSACRNSSAFLLPPIPEYDYELERWGNDDPTNSGVPKMPENAVYRLKLDWKGSRETYFMLQYFGQDGTKATHHLCCFFNAYTEYCMSRRMHCTVMDKMWN